MAQGKKTNWTAEQVAKIEEMAANGSNAETIATALGVPDCTLRDNFKQLIAKKHAERRNALRAAQTEKALKGDTTMLIWLGKNDLGQTDKLEHGAEGIVTLLSALQNRGRKVAGHGPKSAESPPKSE